LQTYDGAKVKITSTHHNAMNPYRLPKEDYKLIAWTNTISPFHLNGEYRESYMQGEKEVEICYFRKTNALGIQGHPEMLYRKVGYHNTIRYCRGLVDKLLKGQL
jgi:hypothetical protein